ncbi:MAG: flippase activity-associated protein Agl23, partial [Planctomycetota bacterium]
MRHTYLRMMLMLFVVFLAAALRLPRLGVRPMHADESVQAARFRDLWRQGDYVYDPNEYHGPTLMYATLPAVVLGGALEFAETTAATYRLVPAIFGIALVASIFLFARTLGTTPVAVAALLAAVSPAMVFYSRYYIHETLLVFFTVAALACGWRYYVNRWLPWCLLAGGCVGLMQATKETAAISYLAAAVASGAVWVGTRPQPSSETPPRPWPWKHLTAAAAVAVVVSVVFLSSFFTNWQGPVDGILTYVPWLSRAGGDSPHVHAWSFYLRRLAWWHVGEGPVWSEGLILVLGFFGLVHAATVKRRADRSGYVLLIRWLVGYAIAITAIYAFIPYKTPWCMLQFLIGIILLAGVGAGALFQWLRLPFARLRPEPPSSDEGEEQPGCAISSWLTFKSPRYTRIVSRTVLCIVAVFLLAGAGHLGWQAYRASFLLPADPKNPYVFAQTSADIRGLTDHLRGLAKT